MNFPFAAAQPEESRRTLFAHSGIGLGSLAMATLWDAPATTAQAPRTVTHESLRPRQGHFPATAKNVIYLFMVGGPSHLDLFDYKPQLERYAGQPMPDSYIGKVKFEQIRDSQPLLMPSPWGFSRAGETGRYISNLLHVAQPKGFYSPKTRCPIYALPSPHISDWPPKCPEKP